MEHQLAAILYADVAGYSRLTGLDEEGTHRKLDSGLNLLAGVVAAHGGKKIHEAGDAILAEFQSVTAAVDAAVEFQREMSMRNADSTEDNRLEFRIGINLGEIIHDRKDIYGDEVNLAARIQELAEPGGICVSGTVYEHVHAKVEEVFDDLGHRKLKNIAQSIHLFALRLSQTPSKAPRSVFFDNLSDSKPVATGGCLCGEIRFQFEGNDIGSSYCHCRMCQRFSGAPTSAGTGFLKDDLRITRGKPKYYVSSAIAERAFCPTCGSSLWMRFFQWKWIFVKTLNLDNPENYAPTTHFGIESQMPWHDIHDDLPRLRCEDSPELVSAWESAGVSISEPPRNVNVPRKA